MSTKELAYKILDNMNEEQLKGFVALFASYNVSMEDDDLSEKEKAYNNLRNKTYLQPESYCNTDKMRAFYELRDMKFDIPADFDEKKELMEALDEKYGSAD